MVLTKIAKIPLTMLFYLRVKEWSTVPMRNILCRTKSYKNHKFVIWLFDDEAGSIIYWKSLSAICEIRLIRRDRSSHFTINIPCYQCRKLICSHQNCIHIRIIFAIWVVTLVICHHVRSIWPSLYRWLDISLYKTVLSIISHVTKNLTITLICYSLGFTRVTINFFTRCFNVLFDK